MENIAAQTLEIQNTLNTFSDILKKVSEPRKLNVIKYFNVKYYLKITYIVSMIVFVFIHFHA